jgi:hypothetical protein
MSLEIFDPTVPPVTEKIVFAPRPQSLNGLKVGLVENTKHNSDVLLLKIAERLKEKFDIEMALLHRKKSASDYVADEAIDELKKKSDFVIAGIGD